MGQTAPPDTIITSPDSSMVAEAYIMAAQGDVSRALLWAIEDLIAYEERCDARIAAVEALVSRGFIRNAFRPRS